MLGAAMLGPPACRPARGAGCCVLPQQLARAQSWICGMRVGGAATAAAGCRPERCTGGGSPIGSPVFVASCAAGGGARRLEVVGDLHIIAMRVTLSAPSVNAGFAHTLASRTPGCKIR